MENEVLACVRAAADRALSLCGRFALYGAWARRAGYLQIADLFDRASGYEREHGAILLEFAADCRVPDVQTNLRDALQRLEKSPYADFAEKAARAQLPETGELFRQLRQIETAQHRCFSLLLDNLLQQTAFDKPEESYWVCRVCGMLVRGAHAPQICPVCGMPRESFSLFAEDY